MPHILFIVVSEEEGKKKDHEKILEEIIVENSPRMGKEIVTQVWETQRVPNTDKPKAKHPKTHINQINKDQTQRTNIKSSKGKTTNDIQGDSHKPNSWSFNRDSSGQKGMRKTYSPDYRTQQGSHSNKKEKSKALQTRKSWENSAPPNQLSNKC